MPAIVDEMQYKYILANHATIRNFKVKLKMKKVNCPTVHTTHVDLKC